MRMMISADRSRRPSQAVVVMGRARFRPSARPVSDAGGAPRISTPETCEALFVDDRDPPSPPPPAFDPSLAVGGEQRGDLRLPVGRQTMPELDQSTQRRIDRGRLVGVRRWRGDGSGDTLVRAARNRRSRRSQRGVVGRCQRECREFESHHPLVTSDGSRFRTRSSDEPTASPAPFSASSLMAHATESVGGRPARSQTRSMR
jgi:hypothetical protein